MVDLLLAVLARGNAGRDASIVQFLAEPIAIVASIDDDRVGLWQRGQ